MNAPLVYPKLTPAELTARWRDLAGQPELPPLWELDEYGEIIEMTPPSRSHQKIVRSIMWQIESQLGGEAYPGLGVVTTIGVRVPDVCWQRDWPTSQAVNVTPTLCVGVQSPANTRRELSEKTAAYLAGGAQEVILVETSGRIRYFGADGERDHSALGLVLTLPPDTYPEA